MKSICTDNPGIGNLLRNNGVYVDKTDVLLKLVTDPLATQFFLSRPRRFGKSMMIDTLLEIFSGNRELLKDTFIGRSDYAWPVYPVIHLDLSKVVASTPEVLEVKLNGTVENMAADFSAPFDDAKPSGENFERLLLHAAATSHLGRADAVLELPNGVWLFEFKYAKTSAAALKQIRDRGYADAYRDDPRPVWLVGCNYSPKKRGLDKPRIVRYAGDATLLSRQI